MMQLTSSHVLYVEPNPEAREEIKRYFADKGSEISVIPVPTLEEALTRLEQDHIACIVSEFSIRGTTGLELLETVRDNYPTLPFIFYTDDPASDLVEEAFRLGATDYLRKQQGTASYRVLERRIKTAISTEHTIGIGFASIAETASEFIDACPIGLLSFDTDGEITFANAHAESILGRPARKLTDLSYNASAFDIVDTDGDPVSDEKLPVGQALTTETSVTNVEIGIQTPVRGRVWISVNAGPYYDDGKLAGVVVMFQDITERIENKRTLEAIVENTSNPIYIKDLDGVYQFVNQAAADVLKRDRSSVLGKTDSELFDKACLDEIREGDEHVIERGETVSKETVTAIDGEERVFLDNKYPYRDEAGEIIGGMGISRDVTRLKETEEKLRALVNEYETVFDTTQDGIFLLDVEDEETFRISRLNAAEEDILGLSTEAVKGKTLYDLYDTETADKAVAAYQQCVEKREPITSEEDFQLGGETRTFQTNLAPVISDGEITQLVGVTRDITDQKQREQQLRERERELRRHKEYTNDVLDAIDDIFYTLDEEGVLQRWNESLAEATGYTDEEIAEMHALDFFGEEEQTRITEAITEVLETGRTRIESELLTKRGERVPYEFVAARLTDSVGNPMIAGIGRDISERVESERQLSRLISNVPGLVYRVRNEPSWPTEFVSEGVREITGYDPETLESGGVSWGEDVAEQNEDVWEEVQVALREHEPFSISYPIRTADGERRWVREQGRGLYAADGSVEAIEGVVIDITERVEYEQELERTQRLLEQSQRLASVGAWEIKVEDGEPGELAATDEAYRINDLSTKSDIGLEEAFGYYHPEDEERIRDAVRRAIEGGESYDHEARLTTPKGNERWVRTIGEPIREDGEVVAVRGAVQDITEQKRREEELERTKVILDHTERLANVGGWEIDVQGGPPFDGVQTDGLYRLHGLSTDEDFPVERGMEFVHPDDREDVERAVERLLVHGEPFDIERRIVTADGELRWVNGVGVPVVENGEITKYRGAMVDITERKRSERTFSLLYEAASDLLSVTTEEQVGQIVVDTAQDLLALPQIILYRFDSTENGFVPLAHSPEVDSPPVIPGSDRSLTGQAFFEDETLEIADVHDSPDLYDTETSIRKGLFIPLEEYGVLFAGDTTPGEFDSHTTVVTELLGTTVRAAFDLVTRGRELEERQWELEQKTAQLERLNQLNELLRGIDKRLVQAESRDELEQAVCEQLVASERYAFAWVGEYDPKTQTVTPRSWAGTEQGYLSEIRSLSAEEQAAEPTYQTARTYEPTVISNVSEGLRKNRWRREALSRGYQSVLSIPLLHDEVPYGVLTVYATNTDAFDSLVRTVFEEVGETIANAMNSVETQQGLVANRVIELELRAYSPTDILHRFAAHADCSITFEAVLPESDGQYLVFFTTPASASDTVQTAGESFSSIAYVQELSTGNERTLFQATAFEPPMALTLAEQGTVPQQITTNGDTLEVTIEVPTTTNVRQLLEVLQARYPTLELVARRESKRPIQTREELFTRLTTELTDRQFEVLVAAYHSGYFESPRRKTGEEIAESLGISQPTFNYHLRRGFKQLLSLILSETGGVRRLDT